MIEGEVLPELEFGVDEAYDTPVVAELPARRSRRSLTADERPGRGASDVR